MVFTLPAASYPYWTTLPAAEALEDAKIAAKQSEWRALRTSVLVPVRTQANTLPASCANWRDGIETPGIGVEAESLKKLVVLSSGPHCIR